MAPQSAHRRPSNADPQDEPATPSARRVRVDSSPGADNPFRQLRNDAGARAHPDSNRDVWEISLWDPTPLALHLFAMFSPVHVAIYWLSLPILASPDTHTSPAAVYFTVILTQALLTAQLLWVKVAFVQQAKDQRYVNKEVMHEYDTKYVQPRLNTRRRDVGVQVDAAAGSAVQIFTPHMSREGWRTNPNPNYADLTGDVPRSARPAYGTPAIAPIRRPVFERTPAAEQRRTMVSTGAQAAADDDFAAPLGVSTGNERGRAVRERAYSSRASVDPEPLVARRMGTEGLVDWSRQNSRGLSPSKMSTPLKRGGTVRGSTYAESLGAPLGTPSRRRQF